MGSLRYHLLHCVRLHVAALIFLVPTVARAQESGPPPAHLARVQGTVLLERDGQSEPAAENMPIVSGDRVRTEGGRAEVMFPDGSSLAIDEDSTVDFESPTRFRVVGGVADRRPAERQGQPSPYLPENLQPYEATLNQNGSWQNDPEYGNVWYPTVSPSWRPYYSGYWSDVRPYGWTWIGLDAWSWPTHHYGRWGHASNRWFWIPGRSWGPAWVSWGLAADYVSWCPLGFNNAPVLALSIGAPAWAAWTVLPRTGFGLRGFYAHRNAIEPFRLARLTAPGEFVQHRTLPAQIGIRQSPVFGRQDARQSPGFSHQPGVAGRSAPSAWPRTGEVAGRVYGSTAPGYRQPPGTPGAPIRPAAPYRAPSFDRGVVPQFDRGPINRSSPAPPTYRSAPSAPNYRSAPTAPAYRSAPAAPIYRSAPAAPQYRSAPSAPIYRSMPRVDPGPSRAPSGPTHGQHRAPPSHRGGSGDMAQSRGGGHRR